MTQIRTCLNATFLSDLQTLFTTAVYDLIFSNSGPSGILGSGGKQNTT